MDDPQSTMAFLTCAAAVVAVWIFARAERNLTLRSQATLERLIEQARPLGYSVFRRFVTKRRAVLAFGIGHLIAGLVFVAIAFAQARWYAGPRPVSPGVPAVVAYGVAGLLSLLLLVVAHLAIPSVRSAEDTPVRKATLLTPWVVLWLLICWPVVWPLDRFLDYLERRRPESREAREEALMALVEEDSEEGGMEPDKVEMISSIMEIGDTTVKEVMVPRVDIVAIEQDRPVSELLALFAAEQHSRIPVYEERIDSIVGIVHAKDVLQLLWEPGDSDLDAKTIADQFTDHATPVLFVPTTKKIDELLRELRREKRHMAVVVDEYGGTAGVITMEDILEEIVGEIQDEYDREEEAPYRWLSPTQVEVDASMSIEEINALLGSGLSEENGYDTLAGFLYHQFSAIPHAGAELIHDAFRFVVKSVSAQRIDKVLIERIEPADAMQARPTGE